MAPAPSSPSSALIRGVGNKSISWGQQQNGNRGSVYSAYNNHDNASDIESGERTALLITSSSSYGNAGSGNNADPGSNGSSDNTSLQDNTTNVVMVVVFDQEMADLLEWMFTSSYLQGGFSQSKFDEGITQHPKTNPKLPPTLRFKRHRNYYIFTLNQFRHWWKTSRLLVRVSGGYEYCLSAINWTAMAVFNVSKHRQSKQALKSMKAIGRGGVSKDFLNNVKPFTRSIRIVLAVARGWEARVDNRLFEVLIAEAFAFMGNRCSRFIARKSVDVATASLLFPFSAKFLAPHLDQKSRPVIVTMGFIRAVLPFLFSFQGSRFGRQLTFNTWKYALHQWQPVQSIMDFNPNASVYQDLELDESLVRMAHRVAAAVGHGSDPIETRMNLLKLGFDVFAVGAGGQAVYRRFGEQSPKVLILTITPYGPSVMGELPRYIILERRLLNPNEQPSKGKKKELSPKSVFIDASKQPEAAICGFLYSSAFFTPQEWAALASRYQATLDAYDKSCKVLNTATAVRRRDKITGPPKDLFSLKEFIRSGNIPRKRQKDNKRWKRLEKEVQRVAATVKRYQYAGTAPKQVIIYLEGLDCSAKSSTGGLVCKALEDSGYAVRTAQHNRPPTAEQRSKGWMDRGRFEYPCDMWEGEEVPEYTAVVWDRGPAGDFVYGSFRKLSPEAKEAKYNEFISFDEECRREGVLFLKLLFVADKDSIASTLGKRLAHKSIAKTDLNTWLDANSTRHESEGLAEIENHIDPTDFIAFNNYKTNISIFTEFALNTNTLDMDDNDQYNNPWTVVNTCKRFPARLQLLKTFERQLRRYAETPKDRASVIGTMYGSMDRRRPSIAGPVPSTYVPYQQKGIALRAVIQTCFLATLLYFYAYITWNFDLNDYVE